MTYRELMLGSVAIANALLLLPALLFLPAVAFAHALEGRALAAVLDLRRPAAMEVAVLFCPALALGLAVLRTTRASV